MMNHFIMADADQCIGCRTCEVACVVAHQQHQDCTVLTTQTFSPRLHLIQSDHLSTVTLCHQCEDAPCANVCPNGAIIMQHHLVDVQQDRCIGCKTCMVACPYGALDVVVLRQRGDSDIGLPVMASKAYVHKCDLCHHRGGGPACIEVCPTKALTLIDEHALEQMKREKQQRAALGQVTARLG